MSAAMPAPASPGASPRRGISDPLAEFVERYKAAWMGPDPRAIADLVTDDVVWRDPILPEPLNGPDEVVQFVERSRASFPDLVFADHDPAFLFEDGDRVSWAWRMRGTFTGAPVDPPGFEATGRRMDVAGVDLWLMRDGRIADYTAIYDGQEVARQLGIAPERGSRAEKSMVAMQRLQARFLRRTAP